MGSSPGQASIDYVAMLALVAVVLALGAGAVGAPWLAPRLTGEIRHGICVVSGSFCSTREAAAAGLAPCPVHVRANAERAEARVLLLRAGRDDALQVEQRSDGTVAISFLDGWRGGATVGLGVQLPGRGAGVEGGAGVSFAAGRVYELVDWPAAERFLSAHARYETLTGEGRQALRRLCKRCRRLTGDDPPSLPKPAATYREGGAWADAAAELEGPAATGARGRPLGGGASAERALLLGRRVAGPRTTTYVRLDGSELGRAGILLASLAAARTSETVLEYTAEGGRPVEARLRVATAFAGDAELLGSSLEAADVARWAEQAGDAARVGAGGLRGDASVALDLRDPANRRAFEAVLRPGTSPLGWAERLQAFARRLDLAGEVDLELFRDSRTDLDEQAAVGAGAKVGGSYRRFEETRHLVSAWSREPGEPLRRREDCEAAAGRQPDSQRRLRR